MKRLGALLCAVVLCTVLLCMPVQAVSAAGYTIENYDVQAQLAENATLRVTEKMTVNFEVSSHGIFRAFPTRVLVQKQTENGSEVLTYLPRITAVDTDEPYTTYTEDDVFYISFGQEDQTYIGPKSYTFTYTYDMGDDRIDSYDELYWSPNGADWGTTISNFSFALTLPKTTDTAPLAVYSGRYGSLTNDAISYTASDSTITGHANRPLDAGEAVTLDLRLPEGYFVGARGFSTVPAWGFAVACVALAAIALLQRAKCRYEAPVETVEFYPPDGVSSADAGFIVDGSADDKDILSLIIWFADKGYLTIGGAGEELALTKVKDADRTWPSYLTITFNGLFEKKSKDVRLSDLQDSFFTALTAARESLTNHYMIKQNRLSDMGVTAKGILLNVFVCLAGFAGLMFGGVEYQPLLAIPAVFALVLLLLSGIADILLLRARRFWKKSARTGFAIGIGAARIIGTLLAYLAGTLGMTGGLLGIVCAAAMLLGSTAASGLSRLTQTGRELTGKLLGLRSFIEKAELPRLTMLVEENPAYFYSVLPYAYVFGLSDKWADQFEKLAVAPPVWYTGRDPNLFSIYWLSRSMNRGFAGVQSAAAQAVMQNAMSSGGHGGTSFGGSGGFSGGGFGGGGGGRW